MATSSSIEWTGATWNPVTGCTRVSAGCDNCYAAKLTRRLEAMGQPRYRGLINKGKTHFNGVVKLHEDVLDVPLGWHKGKVIFVNSMSDLFHPEIPFDFVEKVFHTMAKTPQHTYQVLTKRPVRMAEFMNRIVLPNGQLFKQHPLSNVWLGTSVEDSAVLDRVNALREIPARIRFLSCEPLIGPLEGLNLSKIGWVIVGGESGPGARRMDEQWVNSIQGHCEEVGVPFFFKQWGGVNKKRTGRLLRGREWNEMPTLGAQFSLEI